MAINGPEVGLNGPGEECSLPKELVKDISSRRKLKRLRQGVLLQVFAASYASQNKLRGVEADRVNLPIAAEGHNVDVLI